jgi:hypothetical protein
LAVLAIEEDEKERRMGERAQRGVFTAHTRRENEALPAAFRY